MEFPSIISVIPPTVCLVLAIYISFQGWNDRGIKVFVLLLLALAAYGVFQVIIQTRHDINEIAYLTRYRTALWGLVVPLSYHTVVALMKEKSKKWLVVLVYLYTSGIALMVLSFSGYTIYKEYYLIYWGWDAVMNPGSWFFWAFHSYLVTGMIAFVITLVAIRQQTENYRTQKLAHAILINFIWGGAFTILPYCILSWYKIPSEILLAYLGNVAMFLIAFAIQKYHPEKISTGRMLSNLTPLLPTEGLMITPEKKVLCLSRDNLRFNGFTQKDLEGAGYEKLFVNSDFVDEKMEKIRKNPNYSASFETECNTRNGDIVSLKINISGLRNQFNDVIAYLLVFNKIVDNSNLLEYLQVSYELSDREKEVAELLLNDSSNSEISDRLFISLNTVKTHARNIYKKTNTTNRTELKKFCRNLAK